jgi:prepilin-type processing-associated H-X9-DG protein
MENNSGLLVAAYTDYPQYNMIWSQNTCWWGGADSIQTRWGVKNTNGQLDSYLGIKPKLKTPATQDFGGDPQYKIYQCPSDPKSSYNKFRNKLYYGVWGNSYYYNAYLVKLDTMGKWPAPSQNGKYKRITEVKNTSRSILFTEMSAVDCAGRFDRNNWLPGQNWKWSLHEYPGKPGGRQTGNMVVFVDGHVSFVRFTPGSYWDAEYTFFGGNSF